MSLNKKGIKRYKFIMLHYVIMIHNLHMLKLLKLPCRSASPELWRANRTAQHLEDDFGMLSPDAKINPTRQLLPAGNHIEERIRRRAEIDAKAETGEFRAVRYKIFITLIQYYVVNFYFILCFLVIT